MGHGEPDAATVNALASGLGDALDHYDKILSKQSYLTRNVSCPESIGKSSKC
jgi:hypothetical protein